jgi:glycosyltransferase involved in cell wall biosynthesis
MKPFGIALLADWYCGWMGGANILAGIVNCLLKAAPAQEARLYVLMDAANLPEAIREQVVDFLPIPTDALSAEGPLRCFVDAAPALPNLLFYRDLPATLEALRVDVIGPSGQDLGAAFPRPWFAYIPDFQHQYLPHYFSQAERMARDREFRAKVENAAGVFVNSATVASDIARFFPGAARTKRVLRLPAVLPDVTAGLVDRRADTLARYGQSRPYLLSCSQRWMHKQHEFVLTGFAEHLRTYPDSPLELLFTGEREDHRDPSYGHAVEQHVDTLGLRGRVRHLGMVPREEQLQLIAGAHALVQASLFEGGPGASGAFEAALLGTPILASDIEPNRELPYGRTLWFDAQNSWTLARAIQSLGAPEVQASREPPFAAEDIAFLQVASGLSTIAALRAVID